MQVPSLINGRLLDEIRLQNLQVSCTIGIYPEEAQRTQLLRLNISLYLDTRAAARSGQLHKTVDYAVLARELNFILTHARFRLLESAAEALATFMLAKPFAKLGAASPSALIEAVDLEIIKPEALPELAIPSIKIFRQAPLKQALNQASGDHAEAQSPTTPEEPLSELIFASPEAALFRISVGAGAAQRLQLKGWKLQAIFSSEAELKWEGQALTAGICHEHLATRLVLNESEETKILLALAHRPAGVSQDSSCSSDLGFLPRSGAYPHRHLKCTPQFLEP